MGERGTTTERVVAWGASRGTWYPAAEHRCGQQWCSLAMMDHFWVQEAINSFKICLLGMQMDIRSPNILYR